jgi:hypothetical protein
MLPRETIPMRSDLSHVPALLPASRPSVPAPATEQPPSPIATAYCVVSIHQTEGLLRTIESNLTLDKAAALVRGYNRVAIAHNTPIRAMIAEVANG